MLSKHIKIELNKLIYASRLKKLTVDLQASEFLFEILQWLMKHGYIYSFETIFKPKDNKLYFKYFRIFLKYLTNSRGILDCTKIPAYTVSDHTIKHNNFKKYQNCVLLLTTSNGLKTNLEAKRLNLGGQQILRIYL